RELKPSALRYHSAWPTPSRAMPPAGPPHSLSWPWKASPDILKPFPQVSHAAPKRKSSFGTSAMTFDGANPLAPGEKIGRAGREVVRSRAMSTSLSPLLAPMLSSGPMRAVCDDMAMLQHMLDFEAALARAEATCDVIPKTAAGPIAAGCKADRFDLDALAEAATRSGNLAIPLVKALTAHVAQSRCEAARYGHLGPPP